MAQDKYSAVWVSHSSISDFLKCPRLYYLKNIYKNERGKKVTLTSPALSLGIAVHETVEGLKNHKVEERFSKSLEETFEKEWIKVSGKMGGFKTIQEEAEAKERGKNMILRVMQNPGPLLNKTIKLPEFNNGMPPNYFISQDDNIILNGKIDWLEYIETDDSLRVIDFKTGKNEEKKDSLQLPIYILLLTALQKRKISGAAYWYLDKDNSPVDVPMPDIKKAHNIVLAHAKKIKEAREKNEFNCPRGPGGCFACKPMEKILKGEAEFVGIGNYGQEIYII